MFLPVLFIFLFRFTMSDPAAASTSLVGVPALVAAPVAVPEVQVPITDPNIQVFRESTAVRALYIVDNHFPKVAVFLGT